MIENFRHACVVVMDLDRALKFYRDILGLKVVKVLDVEGKYPEAALGVKGVKLTYAKLRCPSQRKGSEPVFELHYWKKPRASTRESRNHVSFTVAEIDREYKRLRRLGVKFLSKPIKSPDDRTKICFGYDPDNNLIEFVEDLE